MALSTGEVAGEWKNRKKRISKVRIDFFGKRGSLTPQRHGPPLENV